MHRNLTEKMKRKKVNGEEGGENRWKKRKVKKTDKVKLEKSEERKKTPLEKKKKKRKVMKERWRKPNQRMKCKSRIEPTNKKGGEQKRRKEVKKLRIIFENWNKKARHLQKKFSEKKK